MKDNNFFFFPDSQAYSYKRCMHIQGLPLSNVHTKSAHAYSFCKILSLFAQAYTVEQQIFAYMKFSRLFFLHANLLLKAKELY